MNSALTMTMKQQREQINGAMSERSKSDIVFLISSKWWRSWHDLPSNSKIDKSTRNLLKIDNSHLVLGDDESDHNELSL